MSRQKQLFERSSQRERSDFEMMKETLNIDSIEAPQVPPRRRGRPPERERREGYRGARDGARGGARGGVEGGTDVPMKDVF